MATEIESAGVTDTQCIGIQDSAKHKDGHRTNNHKGTAMDGDNEGKEKKSEIRVYKKSSLNGKITVYLGKRDFVDHIAYVDPIDGVVLIDRDYVKDKKVFGHVLATFSYGRDDLDVLGLTFRKELYLVNEQIFPDTTRRHYSKSCPYYIEGVSDTMPINPEDEKKPPRPLTRLQERLVKKLGSNAYPFFFELPPLCPASVTLQPGPGDSGKPCGVDYELKAYIANSLDEKPSKRDSIRLAIRKIMYAPSKQGEQPMVEVSKDFMMSPNKLNLEVSLDKELYHHGESIAVNVHISNNSNRTVKKIKVSVRQFADICLFSTAQYKCTVAEIESEEGCPVGPGSTLSKVYYLRPLLAFNKDKRGLALDGQLKHEDTNLASSTLLTESSQKENLGIVVQYKVRVKLSLGPLGGDISAELPVTLMHPKPEGEDDLLISKSSPIGIGSGVKVHRRGSSKNPLEMIFGRTTACKCFQQEEDSHDNNEKAKQNEQDLIQLDDDNDIVFEDFARLQLDQADLSSSTKSNEETQACMRSNCDTLATAAVASTATSAPTQDTTAIIRVGQQQSQQQSVTEIPTSLSCDHQMNSTSSDCSNQNHPHQTG
uniref:Putative beta-arrestin n=1 Tax=Aceria tosichella TaxID=561515 RepID=A0A6G1SB31_9ACAR